MTLFQNGNFGIGTTTDAGYRLDVNGTARLNGLTSINGVGVANTALAVYGNGNGGGNYLFRMYDASAVERFFLTASGNFKMTSATDTGTSGDDEKFRLALAFAPTSGTRTHVGLYVTQTINQTGGANGITRGLYINPTLTAAADFRAIETTAGKVCLNTSSGNTMIGTTTDAGFKLDVNGTARVNSTGDALTLSPGSSSNALIINNGGYVRFTSGANSYIRGFSTNFQIMDAAFTTRFSLSWGGGTSYFNTTGNFVFGATTANASSMLQIDSTTQGFLPPRMTTTQKNAIASPAAGLVVYDTTLGKLCVRTASAWETITSI